MTGAGSAALHSFSQRCDSSSSSRNSNCSICRCSLSDFRPKLHAVQLGQQQLQMLNLALARLQLPPRGCQPVFDRKQLYMLGQDQRS